MNSCVKYILLLLAPVLACAGMQVSHGGIPSYTFAQEATENKTQESLSGGEVLKFPGLFSGQEHLSGAQQAPAPSSKNHPNGFILNTTAFELRLQHIASQYIQQSKHIHRSLSIGDIIFPFHYFW